MPTRSRAWRPCPSRDTLLAEAIGAITAPMSTMAGLLDAPLRDVAGLISSRCTTSGSRRPPDPHLETDPAPRRRGATPPGEPTPMATLTPDQLLEAFEQMTVLELSEFKKKFEDRFGVTAAAPVALPRAPPRPPARAAGRRGRRGADRVHRRPDRDWAQQDPRHQGRPRAHRARAQGGQGPRRRGPQARQGGRRQGRGREDQGGPRGSGRQGRDQVGSSRTGGGLAAARPPATGEPRRVDLQ